MQLPPARGSLSEQVFEALRADRPAPDRVAPSSEEDLHVTLWTLYELHYRGFDGVDDAREWDPTLLDVRAELEESFEASLRELTAPLLDAVNDEDPVAGLTAVVAQDGPSIAAFLHREATAAQAREFLTLRSVYHLKETDPSLWLLPRISGAAKVALAELAYDEFGAGLAPASHPHLYAEAMTGAGLDPTYGAYLDAVPAHVLAVNNAMSFFGLHRRLRGAGAGHLAAFEMTSSIPCRRILQGMQRLGLGPAVERYFDEHVEADAVHEHLAAADICGSLVADEPRLLADVLFGAAVCVALDAASAEATITAWRSGRSALRVAGPSSARPLSA